MPTRHELETGVIAVLLGGRSEEREISIATGQAVARALSNLGYSVEQVDPLTDGLEGLASMRPVAAFIALHGRFGEDGCVQGLLECLGVPYTGSSVSASAIAMDKVAAKRLVSIMEVASPEYVVYSSKEVLDHSSVTLPFALPAVVKPAREGSSVGISIVTEEVELGRAIAEAAKYAGSILIEKYIKGREISIAVLDGKAIGTIEIVPARSFYDYEAKYGVDSGTRYHYPPLIQPELDEVLRGLAVRVFEVLGCDGVCRVDFMVDENEEPWFIEINTSPGMTETSLVPKIATGIGISFEELCERLLLGARLKA